MLFRQTVYGLYIFPSFDTLQVSILFGNLATPVLLNIAEILVTVVKSETRVVELMVPLCFVKLIHIQGGPKIWHNYFVRLDFAKY